MSNIKRSFALSDVLDLSKKSFRENTIDLTLDIKGILSDYMKDPSFLSDTKSLEMIINQMSAELQIEESIATVLLAMKSSQSKSFSNQGKHILTNKSIQQEYNSDTKSIKHKAEAVDNSLKNEDFHLTLEMSRKILDHQFMTRQKMINTQLEKALYETQLTGASLEHCSEFIPTIMSQEFIALVGFNKVIDILKEQQTHISNEVNLDYPVESLYQCHQCGSDASPAWKKRKIDENSEEVICSLCNDKMIQIKIRIEIEERIRNTKLQFEEQERNLIRDYNDMLSSPKKLELFRQEQEKRQRAPRMSSSAPKTNRLSIQSSQNIKSNSIKQNLPLNNKSFYNGKNIVTAVAPMKTAQRTSQVKELNNSRSQPNNSSSAESPGQLTYLQFLQALTLQVANSQQHIDQENLQKLEQILSMIQANPMLANNSNMTVLQMIAKLSTNLENASNNGSIGSVNGAASISNTNLLNLLTYFANLMQTQQNQSAL